MQLRYSYRLYPTLGQRIALARAFGCARVVFNDALADLNAAYRNFFDSVTGKRKGPKIAPPRFRSRKDSQQGIRFTLNARFKVLGDGRLRPPKIGDVEVRWSRQSQVPASRREEAEAGAEGPSPAARRKVPSRSTSVNGSARSAAPSTTGT